MPNPKDQSHPITRLNELIVEMGKLQSELQNHPGAEKVRHLIGELKSVAREVGYTGDEEDPEGPSYLWPRYTLTHDAHTQSVGANRKTLQNVVRYFNGLWGTQEGSLFRVERDQLSKAFEMMDAPIVTTFTVRELLEDADEAVEKWRKRHDVMHRSIAFHGFLKKVGVLRVLNANITADRRLLTLLVARVIMFLHIYDTRIKSVQPLVTSKANDTQVLLGGVINKHINLGDCDLTFFNKKKTPMHEDAGVAMPYWLAFQYDSFGLRSAPLRGYTGKYMLYFTADLD